MSDRLPSMLGLKIAASCFAGLFLSEVAWDIYTHTVLFPSDILALGAFAGIAVLCGALAWGLE